MLSAALPLGYTVGPRCCGYLWWGGGVTLRAASPVPVQWCGGWHILMCCWRMPAHCHG